MPPFEPHVEVLPEAQVLRFPLFDLAAASVDVQREGGDLVDQLIGAFAITHGSRPVRAGAVVEFINDGNRHREVPAPLVAEVGWMKSKATTEVLDTSGNELPAPTSQPSEPQK